MIPTVEQVMKFYSIIARAERMKSGRPGERTVLNALRGARAVCEASGLGVGAAVDQLTRKAIDDALVVFLNHGISRLSAWSYVCQLQSLFARWSRPYYEDRGWEIPKLELPVFHLKPQHYVRPDAEILRRVKAWYKNLAKAMDLPEEGTRRRITSVRKRKHIYFAATMMLEFAMRNGDILRLSTKNFTIRDGRHYLSYVPHKTELTSGRRVFWPIHDDIWARIMPLDLTLDSGVFDSLNDQLRRLGFHGNKASYELRKICIDHIYQRFGAEMATSISGDDIKTISRYYADPAQPNIGKIRVVDLL